MVLTLVICQIFLPWVPSKREHILCYLVTYPKKSHFHRSRTLPFDGVIRNSDCCRVIAVHRCFWLQMPHVRQCFPEYYSILTVVEEGSQLGLRRWCHHEFHDGCVHVKCTIDFYGFSVFWHPSNEKIPACFVARTGFWQVLRCVQVYILYHIGRIKSHFCFGIACQIIKELHAFTQCFGHCLSLFDSNYT